MKNNSRLKFGLVLLAFAGAVLLGYFLMGPHQFSDRKKSEQVLKLYMDHRKEFEEIQEVSPREAMELFNTGKVVFIDVRDANEQNVSHLPGAVSIDRFIENFESYHDFIKIGYATIGYRSGLIARELLQKGIPVYNLRGGLLAWVHAGGNVYDEFGETRRIHVYHKDWNLAPEGYESIW